MNLFAFGLLALLLGGACTSEATIQSATVSVDGSRVLLGINTCNKELGFELIETAEEVSIEVRRAGIAALELGGGDCLDHLMVQLASPLDHRSLLDAGLGAAVLVEGPLEFNETAWPYDPNHTSEAEYLEALDGFVSCVETTDPSVTIWIEQRLDWKGAEWKTTPNGEDSRPPEALAPCEKAHLYRLRPVIDRFVVPSR